MFLDYEHLIDYAKDLPNDYDRIALICSYVTRNVQFNYAEALKGSLFSDIDSLVDLSMSENSYLPNYKELITAKLYNKLQEMCEDIFTDNTIKNNTIDRIIAGVSLTSEKRSLLKMLGQASDYIGGSVYESDLLRFGVCSDITDFVSSYFNELNIKNTRVIGESHGLHEWLLVTVGGKDYHMDLTDSLYVRDGSYHMEGDATSYYLMTLDNLFELDPNRKIRIIGYDVYDDEEITKDNYSSILGGKKHV